MDCDSSHSFNRCFGNDVRTHNESVNSTAYSLAIHCIGNSSYSFDSGCNLVFIECRHGKSGSIPLLFLTIPCFIQGIILLILNQVFESLVRQGLAIQAYYTMPPVLAIVLLAFSILALFSNMSWILTTTIKKPSDFYYQNLFVLGQIKSKMASSAKTMGVISCILILSIVLMAWLPVNAIRASEYQKITSPFDVQVLTTYSASSLEELPKTTLDYDYITKYLNENGYPLSKAATGQLYLLQADDIDKTVKNAPLLAISVDSYNQMRALSDLPEITLDSDEYGIAWSFDTLPETITQFNQEVSSIHAGNSTLHKNLVRIIKTQQEWCYLQAVCRLCTSYLMKYAIIF